MTPAVIHSIWRDVLKRSDFSDDDDFFMLGGHSLLMADVQVRISQELGPDIPMDKLFRYSTINRISEFMATQVSGDVSPV